MHPSPAAPEAFQLGFEFIDGGDKVGEALPFLLNHLISEELPASGSGAEERISNSDPITGQAAWYDVRVKIYKVGAGETAITSPQFETMKPYPGMKARSSILAYLGIKAK